jgi:hypothetical protein
MTPAQYERLLDRLSEVRNTDDLFDLELRVGPFDEEDAVAVRALFQLACARCHLSRGPVPSAERFTLVRPAPAYARERFEVRGRVGTRIVRVGWADGSLFGSLYALRLLECGVTNLADAASAHQRIRAVFDVVLDEVRTLAVA